MRLDTVAAARGEARSTVIEHVVRNGLAEEESFLRDMEDPAYRVIMELLTTSPKVLRTMATIVGEQLSEEELAEIVNKAPVQVARGKKRQQAKRGQGRPRKAGTP